MSDKPTPTKSESFETIQPDKLEDEMMEPAIVNALAHLIRTIQSVETDNPERVRIAAMVRTNVDPGNYR